MLKELLKVKRRQTTKAKHSNREASTANFIPYHHHYDKDTIITKDRELLQVIRLEGFSFETADDEDVDMKKLVRNSLLKSMASGTLAIWFHAIRRRQSLYPGGRYNQDFAAYVNRRWQQKHQSHDSYINELYITVVRKPETRGVAKFQNWLKSMYETADKQQRDMSLRDAHKELNEAVQRVLSTLKDYGPKLLTTVETEVGVFSEPLEFLGRIINGNMAQPMLVPTMDVSHYLCNRRLYFGESAIEIRGPNTKRFGAIISIKEYAPATAAGISDGFLQLPFEFIISQSFTFINRQTSIGDMQLKQRRMIQAEDVAVSQVAEISDALDMAMSGHVAFGEHHFTILVLEDNLQALERAVSLAIAELVNVGVNPVQEKFMLEPCFWAQLPANWAYIGRPSKIHTLNLAGFASLHNYPPGRIANNHWGDAVTVFDTASGTPYFFNFHLRDVGHTTIIGPTGAGKTVLMNFLCAQSMKFNCRMFLFDKDRGAEIFVRASEGLYNVIDPGNKCGFNPLQLPDTAENRGFLGEWMASLVTVHDETLTAEDMARITEAVNGNYKLAKKDRKLSNIAPFLGLEGPGTIAGRLRMWHSGGQFAGIFDNETDNVDFNVSPLFGFEMGEVLSARVCLAPVLLYLFHRINLSLDGTPTIIVLDEAWALIDNKIFARKIKDWLKTLRKLNAMVVFATQSVEDATNSDISDTLIQQTATQIFLPNPKATEMYKKAFMISDREFNLLKSTDPGSRFFLVKHGKEVVVARIDLSGMEDIVNVLSGRAETVAILNQLRAEVGNDPAVWLPIFQDRVKKHMAKQKSYA